MLVEDFAAAMTACGYKRYSGSNLDDPPRGTRSVYRAEKRLDGDPCLTNDRICIHVQFYDAVVPDVGQSVEIRLVGEYADGLWADLSIYGSSMTPEKFVERRAEYEHELLTAWNSMCAVRRTMES